MPLEQQTQPSLIEIPQAERKSQYDVFKYPKGYRENMAWRASILSAARQPGPQRDMIKELFYRDILFAFNAFFFTLDVRKRPYQHQPFCTYPFQDWSILDLYYAVQTGRDRVVEKSRDMGATWMVVGTFLWFWLRPSETTDFLLGSRVEDYVDRKGDPRTIMEKFRYLLGRLPKWLFPQGWDKGKHDNYMKLINPETGSTITGESSNQSFSTGGRYSAIFYDEFAKWEIQDELAWTAGGDASPCRIAVSTPFGAGGKFYDLVCNSSVRKQRLHWTSHPEKAAGMYPDSQTPEDMRIHRVRYRSPWYDNECQRRGADEIAQELDINYLGSGRTVFAGDCMSRIQEILSVPRPVRAVFTILADGTLRKTPAPRDEEEYLMVWGMPETGMEYVMGVDVVEGNEAGDYAIIKVMNRMTKSVDASIAGHIDEVTLAHYVKAVSDMYYPCWVGIETNGPGLATFDLCTFGVQMLFMMPSFDSVKGQTIHSKGWKTTGSSRNILIAGLRDWLIDKKGWTNPRCAKEMTTFIYTKAGKAEARKGCHDDEVMAMGIAIQVDTIAPMNATGNKYKTILTPEERVRESLFVKKSVDEMALEDKCFVQSMNRRAPTYFEEMFERSLQ